MGIKEGNLIDDQITEQRQAISNKLKQLRETKGLNQHQFGAEIGVGRATISKIESGKYNFTIDTLIAFAIKLDSNVRVLKNK